MASQDPSGSDGQRLEALAKQLADLERQATELGEALRRSGSVRVLLVLVVAALLGVYGYLYFSMLRSFTDQDNMNQLMTELQLRANENSETVLKQAQILYEHTRPTVVSAVSERFDKDMPVFMNLFGAEREILAANLQSRLDSLVQAQYRKALNSHRAILKEQFPAVQDDDAIGAMIGNFEDALQPLVKRYYGEKLRAEFARMERLWQEFPMDDTTRDRETLTQELYHLLFALMQHKLAASHEDVSAKATAQPGVSSGS